jgi:hypothetical protein
MSGGQGAGTLILSIDLELDQHDEHEEGRLDAARTRLIELAHDHGICATWAVADPLLSVATDPIFAANMGHEIAVLGDRAWIGPGCGRVRLRRELARRFTSARKAGIPVSTLALHNTDQVLDLDLLLEHGVTALRGPALERSANAQKSGMSPIRFGLWQPPAARRLTAWTGWWLPAEWLIRREIQRTIRLRSTLHLHLDAATIVAAPEPILKITAAVLRFIAARRDAGQLAVRTMGELAREALGERSGTPSRSILRPAA